MKTLELKYSKGLLDFHNHTNESDGGDTPTQLVERAKQQGITAMALTDHHVISGLEEFLATCDREDIFAIPFGTELHVELPSEVLTPTDNEAPDVVILGKNPKHVKRRMQDYENFVIKDRQNRFLPQTISRLREMGFKVPDQILYKLKRIKSAKEAGELGEEIKRTLVEGANLEVLTAHVLNNDPSIKRESVSVRHTNKYIFAIGQPGYVKRFDGFTTTDAISLSQDMNCKLFIAHPGGEYGFLTDAILSYFIQQGVPGIETRSYFNTAEQNAKFDSLAAKHRLIRSGGSDCHGDNGPFKIGMYDRPQNQLPKDTLEHLWNSLPD